MVFRFLIDANFSQISNEAIFFSIICQLNKKWAQRSFKKKTFMNSFRKKLILPCNICRKTYPFFKGIYKGRNHFKIERIGRRIGEETPPTNEISLSYYIIFVFYSMMFLNELFYFIESKESMIGIYVLKENISRRSSLLSHLFTE